MMPDTSNKTVAIHQPNYFPWLGYFLKISLADTFVFLDDVEINKEGYTRRTKIRRMIDTDDVRWLTVPLDKYSHKAHISDLKIEQTDWQKSHLTILSNTYKNSPFYNDAMALVENIFNTTANISHLSELNIAVIEELCKKLQLETRFVKSSELDIEGRADSYTYKIANSLTADIYIRGKGEAQYSRSTLWNIGDIDARDLDSMQIIREIPGLNDHLPGTSILDALFTIGIGRVSSLLHSIL